MNIRTICPILMLSLPQTSLADVWVPPWGEMVYDSTLIEIQITDSVTTVDVRTRMAVCKLVSDDYLLNYLRLSSLGCLSGESAEVEVSDSLVDFDADSDTLSLRFLSQVALEDTLRLTVHTRSLYPADSLGNSLDDLCYLQQLFRNGEEGYDSAGPPFEDCRYYTRIRSNQAFRLREWTYDGWINQREGSDLEVNMEDYWSLGVENIYQGLKILLSDRSTVCDTLSDQMFYNLIPEVRRETPDLIDEEEVTIRNSWYGHYHQLAEINLATGLAIQLAPMWLWYPNDQIGEVKVDLVGLFLSGAWGNDFERWKEDSLKIKKVEEGDQKGFFIYVPRLEKEVVGQDYWWWSDARLRVEISDVWEADSCRFIFITAPCNPSRITFLLNNGNVFTNWISPFDSMAYMDNNSIVFFGNCPEPGVAQVWWGVESAPRESELPVGMSLDGVYPNPFNQQTAIGYQLSAAGEVSLRLYDLEGRLVQTLVDGRLEAGEHRTVWDARDVPAGIYLVRLEAAGQVRTVKAVLVK